MQGLEAIGILGWIGGWLVTKSIFITGRVPVPKGALIKLPMWLFILCGWPRVEGLPIGIVTPGGVLLQLFGLLLVLYRVLVDRFWSLSWIEAQNGLSPQYVIGVLLLVWLIVGRFVVGRMLRLWPYP